MRKLKPLIVFLLLMTCSTMLHAQNESAVGKFMRSTERSYVVIAVMITILAGLIIYIARLDRKIGKLEKESRHNA